MKMKKLFLILAVFTIFGFSGCLNTTEVEEPTVIAQTEEWTPEPQKRVMVRLQGNVRDDWQVYQIIKTAYLNHPFRTRTGNRWWIDYFPNFNAYAAEVKASDLILVSRNPETGLLETFDDTDAMDWLINSYVSSPLWASAKYASPSLNKKRGEYLGNKWRHSHKEYSGNHLYVLKRMVVFE